MAHLNSARNASRTRRYWAKFVIVAATRRLPRRRAAGPPPWRKTNLGDRFDKEVKQLRTSRLASDSVEIPFAFGPFWSRYAQRNQLFANDGKASSTISR
jgi:hypothetical protein